MLIRATEHAGRTRLAKAIVGVDSLLVTFVLTLFGGVLASGAADKSGVTPNTISLPKGPGSVEGLGESFEPTLNTGTAKYRVPLKVPPGTAGHAPTLALQYDGGGGNGPLGFGWSLEIPFVQRQTDKGIPRYIDGGNGIDDDGDGNIDEPDEIDVFINEIKEELVLTASGYYFCENEGPFIRYRRVKDDTHDGWEGTLPNGTLMEFGLSAGSRIMDADTGRIFCWMLERMTDTNGNTIVYTYCPGDKNLNQRYLQKIQYGPGAPPWVNYHFVCLEYEDRSDWFEDCRPGFVVRTERRVREMVIGTQGPTLAGHASGDFDHDGKTDYLNRRYVLAYDTHPHWSLLGSLTWIGADNVSVYPPLRLKYTVADPPDIISADGHIIASVNTPSHVMDSDTVDLVDLNGDALPDVLQTDRFGGAHIAYLNQGEIDGGTLKAIRWSSPRTVGGDELAWNINLSSGTPAVAHLADMDGDGLADLTYKSAAGDVYYFRNQTDLSWGPRTLMNIDALETAPPSPFGAENVKTADLDFNKKMDIVQSIDDGSRYRIWFNLGNGRFSRSRTVDQGFGFSLSAQGVHLADFNGDRVPDIVRIRPTGLQVTAGLGYGRFAPVVFVPLPDYTLDVEQSGQVSKARLQDITGDGLVDLVIERAVPGELWYWINLGNYTLDNRRLITGMPMGLGVNPATRWADMNGNGTTDLLYADGQQDPAIQVVDIGELIGCVPSPNLLVSIDNGIGRKTTIEYTTSTRYLLADVAKGHHWPHPLPFPVHVVSRVVVDDSLGNKYVTEYTYHDGYYDGAEKEFRGFAAVEQRDVGDESAPDLINAYLFDAGIENKALKGKPLRLEAQDTDRQAFYVERYTWAVRKLWDSVYADGRTVMLPVQQDKTRNVTERGCGQPVQLSWEYEYDAYGNMTRKFEQGRADGGWDDERVTQMSYSAAYSFGSERWILNKVIEQSIMDAHGILIAHRRNWYDGSPDLGRVVAGHLTKSEDWVAGDKYIASIRSDFDQCGNIVAMYDPLYGSAPGHFRELIYDGIYHAYPVQEIIHTGKDDPAQLVFSATHDYGFGTVVSTTEFNGFTTRYGYDPFGRLTSVTKPPDTEHTVEYNYGLACAWGDDRTINWVETRQRDGSHGDGFLCSRVFYDGLSRKVMMRTESESPGQVVVTDGVEFNARQLRWRQYLPYVELGSLEFSPLSSRIGFTEHLYDALGRKTCVKQPKGLEGVACSTTTYEPLARIVRDEEQTETSSPYFDCGTRYVEDGLLDPAGKGRLREVYERVKISDAGEPLDAPVEWCTQYSYDLLDNCVGYLDAQNNRKVIEYDALGRMTCLSDPDRGCIHYTYDDAGNLIRTTDTKGQVVTYAYDGVNRLIAEYYADGKTTPDVEYHYDVPFGSVSRGDFWPPDSPGTAAVLPPGLGEPVVLKYRLDNDNRLGGIDGGSAALDNTVTAHNTLGFPSWIRDQSGEEHNSYDPRGRVEWVVKCIANTGPSDLCRFYTAMEYDAMDRVTQVTYPDGTHIRYTYNQRGLLESVPNVAAYTYNPAGQVSSVELACGVITQYDYDHRLRLRNIHSTRNRDNLVLQDLSYTYDKASNITTIVDGRTSKEREQIGAELGIVSSEAFEYDDTQSFTYDTLYRLTQASNPSTYGRIDYRYDRIGNLIRKDASLVHPDALMDLGAITCGGPWGTWGRIGRRAGDPPGPHVVTETEKGPKGPMSFACDDNGNVIAERGWSLSWDAKDRLLACVNGEVNAVYQYDYADVRKKKVVVQPSGVMTTVYYVDKFAESRNGRLVKYVCVRNRRVARSDGAGQDLQFTVSDYYLHDHLASTSMSLSKDGTVREQMCNYPFGYSRREDHSASQISLMDYGYTGQEMDREIGMQYFGSRYYRPYLGRFLSPDKESPDLPRSARECPQNLNVFAYTDNRPIVSLDLTGRKAVTFCGVDNVPEVLTRYFDKNNCQAFTDIAAKYEKAGQNLLKTFKSLGATFKFFGKGVQANSEVRMALGRVQERLETAIKEDRLPGDWLKDIGGFNPRTIRGASELSEHAFGNAVDVNAGKNKMKGTRGNETNEQLRESGRMDLPDVVIEAFKAEGFRWGGDFTGKNRFDPMHFEYVGTSSQGQGLPAAPPEGNESGEHIPWCVDEPVCK